MNSPRSSGPHQPRIVAGRYQILRKLGSGGMGAVFLARQITVGNQVALKFLPAHLADDAQVRRRFEREAALTLEVTHPGAAQLLDVGQDEDGQLFLAFEFVEGDDLSTLLDRDGALPYPEALEITLKVAETLAYAHGRGVVHRDIKPENIRVRRDLAGLHVKVLDFGIARVMDDAATRLTVEGGVAGTPRYMAPEQIGAGTVDARTDIYALGLVLFEMLTGREAFDRESTSQLMWAQLNDPVPPLRDVQPPRDHPELDAIIATACAKKSDDRYASMREMVGALKAITHPAWPAPVPVKRRGRSTSPHASGDDSAREGVIVSRPGRTTRVHRTIGVAGLALGGLAVVIAAGALWFAMGRRVETPGASVPTRSSLETNLAAATPLTPTPTPASVTAPTNEPASTVAAALTPATTPTPLPPAATAVPAPTPGNKVTPAPLAKPTAPSVPTAAVARNDSATTAPAHNSPVIVGTSGPVMINGVPVQPGVLNAPTQLAMAPAASPRSDSSDCPTLRMLDPAITQLSVAELERRARNLRYIAPSVAIRQLETLRATVENYAPDMRACMYKAILVQTVLNERTVLQSTPAMWGHTKDAAELERLFMEQPLREEWSPAQRKSVLDQIEKLFIANLAKDAPGDDVYWRRMYYGLAFSCEASDAALGFAKARRPPEGSCPKLKPAG